jgi:ribokinase
VIVGIGTICVDIIAFMDRFPKMGETILGKKVGFFPGGKVSNAVVTTAKLAKIDNFAYMIGRWGKDFFADIARNHFADVLVNTSFVKTSEDKFTNTPLIYVNRKGENLIVCSPGASTDLTKEDIDSCKDLLKECKVFILESGIPFEVSEYAAKIIKKYGGISMFIPAPAQNLTIDLLKNFDYILPNETEFEEISGVELSNNNENIYEIGEELINKGIANIIVTASDKGAYIINSSKKTLIPSYPVTVVDPTGAGDAFAGGFSYGLWKELSIEDCIRLGNITGGIAVTRLGAGSSIPDREEVLDFIKKNKIENLASLI